MNLDYSLIGAHMAGVRQHPSAELAMLGIKCEHWIPQTIADCIWLIGCTNVPDDLPNYITKLDVPQSSIDHYL